MTGELLYVGRVAGRISNLGHEGSCMTVVVVSEKTMTIVSASLSCSGASLYDRPTLIDRPEGLCRIGL